MDFEHYLQQLFGRRENAFEAQLRDLRREVRRVSQAASRQAGHAAHDLSRHAEHAAHDWGDNLTEFGHEAAKRGSELASLAAYQAGRGAKAVRNDPLPLIAVIGTALLAAHLFSRR